MRTITVFVGLIYSHMAWAEVMDKEFSFPIVLRCGALGAIGTFVAARWFPWALAVLLPAVTLFYIVHLSELLDPHVGPAMLHEAGLTYVAVSWLSPLLIVAALVSGVRLRHRIRHQPPNPALNPDAKRPQRAG